MMLFMLYPFAIMILHTSRDEENDDSMFFFLPTLFFVNEPSKFALCFALFNMSIEFIYIRDIKKFSCMEKE